MQLVLHAVKLGIVIISQRPCLILSPLKVLSLPGLLVLDVFVGQRLLVIPEGHNWAGDLPGTERGCAMQGAAQEELGNLSVGCEGL